LFSSFFKNIIFILINLTKLKVILIRSLLTFYFISIANFKSGYFLKIAVGNNKTAPTLICDSGPNSGETTL